MLDLREFSLSTDLSVLISSGSLGDISHQSHPPRNCNANRINSILKPSINSQGTSCDIFHSIDCNKLITCTEEDHQEEEAAEEVDDRQEEEAEEGEKFILIFVPTYKI